MIVRMTRERACFISYGACLYTITWQFLLDLDVEIPTFQILQIETRVPISTQSGRPAWEPILPRSTRPGAFHTSTPVPPSRSRLGQEANASKRTRQKGHGVFDSSTKYQNEGNMYMLAVPFTPNTGAMRFHPPLVCIHRDRRDLRMTRQET